MNTYRIYSNPPGPNRSNAIDLVMPKFATTDSAFYHDASMGRLRWTYRQLRRKRWGVTKRFEDGTPAEYGFTPGLRAQDARRIIFDAVFATTMADRTVFSTADQREFDKLVEETDRRAREMS